MAVVVPSFYLPRHRTIELLPMLSFCTLSSHISRCSRSVIGVNVDFTSILQLMLKLKSHKFLSPLSRKVFRAEGGNYNCTPDLYPVQHCQDKSTLGYPFIYCKTPLTRCKNPRQRRMKNDVFFGTFTTSRFNFMISFCYDKIREHDGIFYNLMYNSHCGIGLRVLIQRIIYDRQFQRLSSE